MMNRIRKYIPVFFGVAGLCLFSSTSHHGLFRDSSVSSIASPPRVMRLLEISSDGPTRSESVDGKMVLMTPVLPLYGHGQQHTKFVKFHLDCLASLAQQTKSIAQIVVFTADESIRSYLENSHFPLQFVLMEKKEERDFRKLIHRMGEIWPDASSYGFFNGDICPSASMLQNAYLFNDANCTEEKDSLTRYRYVSTVRWNVQITDIDQALAAPDALAYVEDLQIRQQNRYGLRGIDFFLWNRPMYLEHVVPTMPHFTLPLYVADHYIQHDAACNALVLMTEEAGIPDAKVFHIGHVGYNRENDWNLDKNPSSYNENIANQHRGNGWARNHEACSWNWHQDRFNLMQKIYQANCCRHESKVGEHGSFECFQYDVGQCLIHTEIPNERISRRPDVAFVEPDLQVTVEDGSDLDKGPTLRGLPLAKVDA